MTRAASGSSAKGGRTIVIGDVHGCADELEALLEKLALKRGDRLFLVGDLVVRGPSPNRVLQLVREVGGVAVCGNHEWRLLKWRELDRRRPKAKPALSEVDERLLASKMLRSTAADIDGAIRIARKHPNYESVAGICEAKVAPYAGLVQSRARLTHLLETSKKLYRYQDSPRLYTLNGAVWILNPRRLGFLNNNLLGDYTYGFEMPAARSIDIDTEFDHFIAECIARRLWQKKHIPVPKVKNSNATKKLH